MTYELAKQLKDAGFPRQMGEYVWHYTWTAGDPQPRRAWGRITHEGADTLEPTLSELIEACENDFAALYKKPTYLSRADSIGWDDDKSHYWEGSTPEEAVAKLWLDLKKNN